MSTLNRKLVPGFLSRRHRDSGKRSLLPSIIHCLLVLGIAWSLSANASSMFVGRMPTTVPEIANSSGEPFLAGTREFVAHLVFLPLAFTIGSALRDSGNIQVHWLKTRTSGERSRWDWIIPLRI